MSQSVSDTIKQVLDPESRGYAILTDQDLHNAKNQARADLARCVNNALGDPGMANLTDAQTGRLLFKPRNGNTTRTAAPISVRVRGGVLQLTVSTCYERENGKREFKVAVEMKVVWAEQSWPSTLLLSSLHISAGNHKALFEPGEVPARRIFNAAITAPLHTARTLILV